MDNLFILNDFKKIFLDENESALRVYVIIPQYIVMGVAQLFFLLAYLEFAYLVAPRSAQSLFFSLYYFSRSAISYAAYTLDFELSKHKINFDFLVSIKLERYLFFYNHYFSVSKIETIYFTLF